MNINFSEKKSILLLFVIYFATNFFLLINDGIYWDDWVLYNQNAEDIKLIFYENSGYAGNITSSIHLTLLNIGVLSYRALTVILFFSSLIILALEIPD